MINRETEREDFVFIGIKISGHDLVFHSVHANLLQTMKEREGEGG